MKRVVLSRSGSVPPAPVSEDGRDADDGRRTTGAACPARRGTGARRRRPGSGATGRGSRGGPASRKRPSPRGRRRSCSTPLAKTPQNWRNPAVRTQSGGAVSVQPWPHMGYPTPTSVRRRTLRRVARSTEHGGVGDVERRTTSGQRDDVIDGKVSRLMGGALVARTPLAVLTTPGAEHAGAESLPGASAVGGVVPAAVDCRACVVQRLPGRLVRTPHTLHIFTGCLARSCAVSAAGDARMHGGRHGHERGPGRRCGLYTAGARPPEPRARVGLAQASWADTGVVTHAQSIGNCAGMTVGGVADGSLADRTDPISAGTMAKAASAAAM